MTHVFESAGPLDWTAAEERLERIRPKLGELEREAGSAFAREACVILDDPACAPELRRDRVSTRLMEAFRAHQSRAAFACLYELNAAHLYQQVSARLRRYRCRADALDVLQEVFFNVYRYPHRFDCAREDAFRVWTATIVRNTVLKHLRSLSRNGRGEVALDELAEPSDASAPEPVRDAIEGESSEECRRVYFNYLYLYLCFYQMLSEREQRAIQMVEVDGMSYREAARELRIKLENLKMVIFRARRKIHRSMRRVFDGLPPDLRPARVPGVPRLPASGPGRRASIEHESLAMDEGLKGEESDA